jgi:hypothetical protein
MHGFEHGQLGAGHPHRGATQSLPEAPIVDHAAQSCGLTGISQEMATTSGLCL